MYFTTVTLDNVSTSITERALDGLRIIYRDLESTYCDCEACGSCCKFSTFGHQLWLTEIELVFLARHHGLLRPVAPGACPYLEGQRCRARAGRALGCRVFSCKSPQIETEIVHELYFDRIRDLAKRENIDIHYGEFLETLKKAIIS